MSVSGEEDDEEIRVSECSHWGVGSMIYGLVGSIFWFVMRSSKATMEKILI